MEPLKILVISYNCCIRVIKESHALAGNGHTMHFMHRFVANSDLMSAMPSMSFYETPNELAYHLQNLDNFDIIHVHNEPDWMVSVVRQNCPGAKIVYDCHDLNSQRNGMARQDEIEAMRDADAYIFPSKAYMKGAVEYHDLPDTKPRDVVYSMVNKTVIDTLQPRAMINGICYEGGVRTTGNIPGDEQFSYRDYRDIATFLTSKGIIFSIYGMQDQYVPEYAATGALIFGQLPYFWMMNEIQRYAWSYIGNPHPHSQWSKAMPNKLFESIAAGVPVIVQNAGEVAEYVREHELGATIDTLDDILTVYDSNVLVRPEILKKRHHFTMENEIHKVEAIYKELLSK